MTTDADAFADSLPRGPYKGSREFEWTVNGMRISLRLADLDRLGCLFEAAALKPSPGARLDVDPAGLGQRFSYLGEELVIIEQTKDEGRALLRSSPLSADDTHMYFFELVVDRDQGLSLARYVHDRAGRERKMVPAPLTTHALRCLIADLKMLTAGI